jgi:hypothetical protein
LDVDGVDGLRKDREFGSSAVGRWQRRIMLITLGRTRAF